MKLCECGCGQPTQISDRDRPARGYMKGEPYRFVLGHATRGKPGRREPAIDKPPSPNPSGKCLCGCGQVTATAAYTSLRDGTVYGEHLRFVHGHNAKRTVWQRLTGKNAGRWYVYTRNGQTTPWARIVAENTLGRPLDRSEQVHHINEDKGDDRPENLAVFTVAEHARLHAASHGLGTAIRGIRGRPGVTVHSPSSA